MDDVIIHSGGWAEHMQQVAMMLDSPGSRHTQRSVWLDGGGYSIWGTTWVVGSYLVGSWWYYLLGWLFILCWDNAPLQWPHWMNDTNGHISCWYLALQPFKFRVVHKP